MTIRFIIKHKQGKRKASGNKPDFRVPLYVRIRDGKAMDQTCRTSILVYPKWWDCRKEYLRPNSSGNNEECQVVNNAVHDLRHYLVTDYVSDKMKGRISKDWLRRKLYRYDYPVNVPQNIAALGEEFISDYTFSESCKSSYRKVFRIILRFERFSDHFSLEDMDARGMDKFYEYVLNEHNYIKSNPEKFKGLIDTISPRPRSKNTANEIFKKVRTFSLWCIDRGYIDHSPFEHYKIAPELYGTPVCLTKEELYIIWQHKFDSQRLAVQRDIFIFQCNIGCRVSDLMSFKPSDCADGFVTYIPKKTISTNARSVTVPMNSTARTIISRYAGGERLLPFISVQKYNSSIKCILREAGITRLVSVLDPLTRQEKKVPICDIASSHLARRTFINLLYHNVKDPALVSSLTGHTDGSRAFQRYRTIDNKLKEELVKSLEHK